MSNFEIFGTSFYALDGLIMNFLDEPFRRGRPRRYGQICRSLVTACNFCKKKKCLHRDSCRLLSVKKPRAFVWIKDHLPNKSIRLRQPGRSTHRTPGTIMSTETFRVPNGETYREKALRKFKQQPLVPLGSSNSTYGGPM